MTRKPAFFAVARAFGRRRATPRVARAVWAGESTASAEAWLWAEDAVAAGSTVALRAIGLDGRVFAERTLTAGAVGDPVAVGSLEVAVGELPDVFLWEAEWRDAVGAIDRERMVATTTTDFAALLDLPAPVLDVVRGGDGAVSVRNAGGIAALTVRLVDPRPAGAPGVLTAAGDPRPLLPGEERSSPPTRGCRFGWRCGTAGASTCDRIAHPGGGSTGAAGCSAARS
ncbi:hypothetical protein ACRAWC_22785 [Leifsonia sp. L25]|uniref:hypothetical protein n=1 Tax=Leifsonia sp. L25 TaxID=3423957 RepID=UPI003D69CB47